MHHELSKRLRSMYPKRFTENDVITAMWPEIGGSGSFTANDVAAFAESVVPFLNGDNEIKWSKAH